MRGRGRGGRREQCPRTFVTSRRCRKNLREFEFEANSVRAKKVASLSFAGRETVPYDMQWAVNVLIELSRVERGRLRAINISRVNSCSVALDKHERPQGDVLASEPSRSMRIAQGDAFLEVWNLCVAVLLVRCPYTELAGRRILTRSARIRPSVPNRSPVASDVILLGALLRFLRAMGDKSSSDDTRSSQCDDDSQEAGEIQIGNTDPPPP